MQNPELLSHQATFHVGGIPICGESILSPMDGVSDWPFRSLCRREGSAMSYTEFVRAKDVLDESKSVFKKLTFDQSERPVVFQIYGNDPDRIVEAALRIRSLEPDVIDLNMGCPEKKVANRGAGVGMMRTPLKIARTIRKLVKALHIPVTGKMRVGWEDRGGRRRTTDRHPRADEGAGLSRLRRLGRDCGGQGGGEYSCYRKWGYPHG